MRRRDSQLAFEALSIEGGLFSADWITRIAQLGAKQQADADYRIKRGLNLRDEIGRFWRIGQAHWSDFAKGLAQKSDPHALAERFVLALLRDCFEFGTLVATAPIVVDEHAYPIGHHAVGGHVPVIIAADGLDDLSSRFSDGDGGRRRSATGLLQDYLNADDRALWGLVSDGKTLRLLRDNASLTRPARVEADLVAIFTEERYPDFAVLWLLIHESRFGRADQPPHECALETWRNNGREEGTRAREELRDGFHDAVLALGQGFLSHPDNQALRTVDVRTLFEELLRLVYRIIFLLVAEERGLLHPETATTEAKQLYAEGYGLRQLRDRAARRSAHDRASDLWEGLKIVFAGLHDSEPRLGLPALLGLFERTQCPTLDAAKLENHRLLFAIFKLAWLRHDKALARVNWRDMGAEELGAVYESLLELTPLLTDGGRTFSFATGGEAKGHARKLTGSYYTPDSLVQVLLDQALEPVVKDTLAAHPSDPIDALLGLCIVDPACGSGHFLLAAARRLAVHVARLQANGTPSEKEFHHALRQVVGRCIFGVDLNPMAVELCRVSLWMEALEPGRPLTFLDAHVQVGNALLGATPELLADGIPDDAWLPIEGDDKKAASALKKRNRVARANPDQLGLEFSRGAEGGTVALVAQVGAVDAASDADAGALAKKRESWHAVLASALYRRKQFLADSWCAAFVWPKKPGALDAPTHDVWLKLCASEGAPPPALAAEVARLAEQYHFFHWHLAFPQVFVKGGFDVVLGNPPWERVKLQEQEFFASRSDEIANAPNAAARKKLIAALPERDPTLHAAWIDATREAEGQSHLVRDSGRYPLCGNGDVNTYALFAEHNRAVLGPRGRAGFIVPTGIATDDMTKDYFSKLTKSAQLVSLYDFQSGPGLFGEIGHARFKFCLLALGATSRPADFVFFARTIADLADKERHFSLSPTEFALLNPNTGTCPTFRSRRDADINVGIYRRAGVLWRDGGPDENPWGLRFMRMFDMANDSGLFETLAEADWHNSDILPLIEAKMVHQFDHRYGDYADKPAGSEDTQLPDVPVSRLNDPAYRPSPRYWVASSDVNTRLSGRWTHRWLLGWRRICRSTDERTFIASLIPIAAVGDSEFLLLSTMAPGAVACMYANLSAFAFDFAARQKIGGTNASFHIIRQLPVLAPSTYDDDTAWQRAVTLYAWLLPRVLELTYTAWDLEAFARDVHYEGPPFRWDPDRRALLRAELDAAFFYLYGMSHDDVAYVMDTFPIVRKDDEKAHGEYRTKRLILEVYDALAAAARAGAVYQTPLDPPPADARVAHPASSRPEWARAEPRRG